jgi:hypothetical protein
MVDTFSAFSYSFFFIGYSARIFSNFGSFFSYTDYSARYFSTFALFSLYFGYSSFLVKMPLKNVDTESKKPGPDFFLDGGSAQQFIWGDFLLYDLYSRAGRLDER